MKKGLRVVATITLVCFLTTQSVWGAPGAGIEIASPHEMPTALSIDVPAELGTVDALYEAPGAAHPQFILHIQNAHANYQAQMKIKQLLEHMNKKYGFKTIFVEGAAEKLNPDYLKLFPDQKDNEAFCDSLAKQGELTGAELFLMEESGAGKGASVEGLGIEKTALYRSNYEALKKVFGAETDVNRFFVGFDSKLDRVASKTFTPETRQLIADWKRFEQGRREFMPFVRDLARKSKKILSIDLESLFAQVSWPQISRLLVIQQMEKDLDRTKGIEEKKKLIESLRSQNISKELMGALESFNEGSISIGKSSQEVLPRQLMENLAGEAGPKGFKFSDYPAFSLFAGYVILRSELDPKALFEEIEYLFTRVLDTLAPEPQQKALLALYRDGELLRKLLRLELSRAQWRQLVERKAQVAVPTIVTRLRDAVVASGDTSIQQGQEVMPPAFKEKMSGLFTSGLEFYDFARQREGAFYQEIRTAMSERKITKAVLITGGFHTDGMSDIFRENAISYGIVTPRLSEKSNEKMYRGIMLGKHPGDFDVSYLEAVIAMQSLRAQVEQQGFADISAILNAFMAKTSIMDRAKAVEVFKTTQAYQVLRMGDPAKGSLGFDVVQKKTRDGKPAVDELGRPLFGLEKLTATPEGQAAPSVVPSVAPAKRSESFLGDLMTQRGITLEKWNSAKKLSVWDPDDPDAWVLLVEDDSIRGKILTAGLESVYGKGKVVLARTVDDGLDEIASRASQPYRMILDNTLVGSSLSGQEFVQGLFDEGYETAVVMQTSESTDVKTALSATLKEKTPEVLSKTDFDRMLKAGFPPFLEILGLPSKAEDRAAVRTAPGGISALAKILAVIASLVPGLVKGAPMAETNAPAPAAVTAPVEPGTFTNITSGLRVELMPTGGVERPSFSLGAAATGVVQSLGTVIVGRGTPQSFLRRFWGGRSEARGDRGTPWADPIVYGVEFSEYLSGMVLSPARKDEMLSFASTNGDFRVLLQKKKPQLELLASAREGDEKEFAQELIALSAKSPGAVVVPQRVQSQVSPMVYGVALSNYLKRVRIPGDALQAGMLAYARESVGFRQLLVRNAGELQAIRQGTDWDPGFAQALLNSASNASARSESRVLNSEKAVNALISRLYTQLKVLGLGGVEFGVLKNGSKTIGLSALFYRRGDKSMVTSIGMKNVLGAQIGTNGILYVLNYSSGSSSSAQGKPVITPVDLAAPPAMSFGATTPYRLDNSSSNLSAEDLRAQAPDVYAAFVAQGLIEATAVASSGAVRRSESRFPFIQGALDFLDAVRARYHSRRYAASGSIERVSERRMSEEALIKIAREKPGVLGAVLAEDLAENNRMAAVLTTMQMLYQKLGVESARVAAIAKPMLYAATDILDKGGRPSSPLSMANAGILGNVLMAAFKAEGQSAVSRDRTLTVAKSKLVKAFDRLTALAPSELVFLDLVLNEDREAIKVQMRRALGSSEDMSKAILSVPGQFIESIGPNDFERNWNSVYQEVRADLDRQRGGGVTRSDSRMTQAVTEKDEMRKYYGAGEYADQLLALRVDDEMDQATRQDVLGSVQGMTLLKGRLTSLSTDMKKKGAISDTAANVASGLLERLNAADVNQSDVGLAIAAVALLEIVDSDYVKPDVRQQSNGFLERLALDTLEATRAYMCPALAYAKTTREGEVVSASKNAFLMVVRDDKGDLIGQAAIVSAGDLRNQIWSKRPAGELRHSVLTRDLLQRKLGKEAFEKLSQTEIQAQLKADAETLAPEFANLPLQNSDMLMFHIVVRTDSRRQGIGKQLNDDAIRHIFAMNEALPEAQRTKVLRGTTAMNLKSVLMDTPLGKLVLGRQLTANYNEVQSDEIYTYALVLNPIARADSRMMVPVREIDEMLKYYGSGFASELLVLRKDAEKYQAKRQKVLGSEQWMTLLETVGEKAKGVGYEDPAIKTAQDVLKRLATSEYAEEMAVLLNQIAKRTVIAMPTQPDTWGLAEWQLILEAVDRRDETFNIPGKDRSFAGPESRSLEDPASRVWDGLDFSLRGLKLSDLRLALEMFNVMGAKAQLMTFIADKGRSVGYKDSSIETAQDVLKRLSTSAYAKEMAVLLNQIAKRTVIAMPTQPDAWGLDEWQLILEAVDRRNEIFRIPGKDRSFAGPESRSLEDPASRVWDGGVDSSLTSRILDDVDSSDSSLRGLKLSDLWTAREIVHVVGFDPSSVYMDLDQLMATVRGFAQGVRADLESENEFTWPSFYKRLDAIETQLSRPALMYWLLGRLGKMDGQPLNAEEKQEFLRNLRFAPAVLGAVKKGLDRDQIVEDYGADLSFVRRTIRMTFRAESRVVSQAGEVEKRITVSEKKAAVAAVLKDANLKDSARKTLENTSTAALEKMLPGIQGRPEFSLLSSEENVALALTWGITAAENLAALIGLLERIAGVVSSGTAEGLLERVRAAAPNAVIEVSSEKCVVATVISEIGDVAEFSRGLKLVFLLNPNARLLFLDTGDPAEQQKADQVKAIISAWGKGINNEKIVEQIRFDFSPMADVIDKKAINAFARRARNAGERGRTGFVFAFDKDFLSKLNLDMVSGTPVALAYTKNKKNDVAARILLARAAQLLHSADSQRLSAELGKLDIKENGGVFSVNDQTLFSALANLSQIMAAFESIDKAA